MQILRSLTLANDISDQKFAIAVIILLVYRVFVFVFVFVAPDIYAVHLRNFYVHSYQD